MDQSAALTSPSYPPGRGQQRPDGIDSKPHFPRSSQPDSAWTKQPGMHGALASQKQQRQFARTRKTQRRRPLNAKSAKDERGLGSPGIPPPVAMAPELARARKYDVIGVLENSVRQLASSAVVAAAAAAAAAAASPMEAARQRRHWQSADERVAVNTIPRVDTFRGQSGGVCPSCVRSSCFVSLTHVHTHRRRSVRVRFCCPLSR
jgi:hypothetical protein